MIAEEHPRSWPSPPACGERPGPEEPGLAEGIADDKVAEDLAVAERERRFQSRIDECDVPIRIAPTSRRRCGEGVELQRECDLCTDLL